MKNRYLIEITDGWPILRGPFANAEDQKQVARAMAGAGKQVFWLDAEGVPEVGRVTTADGEMTVV